MSSRSSVLLVLSCASCVAYHPHSVELDEVSRDLAARQLGALDVEAAMRVALRWNPRLRALDAEVRAASAAADVPLTVVGEFRGRSEALGAMVDPVALLGYGARGAQLDLADAQLHQAVAEAATERWRVLSAIVECFHVEAALRELAVPELDARAENFVAAGLAAPVAAEDLRSAQAQARAERATLSQARSDSLDRLRGLLGVGMTAALRIEVSATDQLPQSEVDSRVLLRRPDLALQMERFRVADAEYRDAVVAQYPSFDVGPNVSLIGDPLRAMGMVRIPVGMAGRARAALERRTAAAERLAGQLLRAEQEVAAAARRLDVAAAEHDAAAIDARAAAQGASAAGIALEVSIEGFAAYSQAALRAVRSARRLRVAVTELVRARVGHATAHGWPLTEEGEAAPGRDGEAVAREGAR